MLMSTPHGAKTTSAKTLNRSAQQKAPRKKHCTAYHCFCCSNLNCHHNNTVNSNVPWVSCVVHKLEFALFDPDRGIFDPDRGSDLRRKPPPPPAPWMGQIVDWTPTNPPPPGYLVPKACFGHYLGVFDPMWVLGAYVAAMESMFSHYFCVFRTIWVSGAKGEGLFPKGMVHH